MSTTIEGTTVRIMRSPKDFRKYAITVQVESRVKPKLKSNVDLDPGESHNVKTLTAQVAAAAAGCAEYLGRKYGDNFDSQAVARSAIVALGEEARLIAGVAQTIEQKLRRLESNMYGLDNKTQEIVKNLRWILNRGGHVTPGEGAWVDEAIGKLHGSQL